MQPVFLQLDQVMRIHSSLIENYGGDEGLRDLGLLQSALAVPQASFGGEYAHKNLFEMAAAYLYHLAQNHAFVDGNKRVGAASAIIFLELNGVEVDPDEDGLVELTMGVARGDVGKDQIAAFFRDKAC